MRIWLHFQVDHRQRAIAVGHHDQPAAVGHGIGRLQVEALDQPAIVDVRELLTTSPQSPARWRASTSSRSISRSAAEAAAAAGVMTISPGVEFRVD